MKNIKLGFNSNQIDFNLVERTFHNDCCRSFYFQHKQDFYILYVDYDDIELRVCESLKKYTLSKAANHGDKYTHEIYPLEGGRPSLIETENASELIQYFKQLKES